MPFTLLHERFRVSCLPHVNDVARSWNASHVVSLLDPELGEEHMPSVAPAEHFVARLRDQETASFTGHFPQLIVDLFERVRPAVDVETSRILVHCHAGISRSTAFAYAMIAHRAGAGREQEAFDAFMTVVNKPWPNRRVIEILDDHLDRGGALLQPLDAMRARHPRRLDAWDRFNEKRGFFNLYGRYQR